jgi:PAS domain S-box-containing protein
MKTDGQNTQMQALSESEVALLVLHHIPTMLAYWDDAEICRFANRAYESWFGVRPENLIGKSLKSLLGPLYELNLPYIRGVLAGEPQVFERRIPRPDGTGARDSLATYTPHIVDGVVRGFFAQVTDIGVLKEEERETSTETFERNGIENVWTVCAWCHRVRDEGNTWKSLEAFVTERTGTQFSHGLCRSCSEKVR